MGNEVILLVYYDQGKEHGFIFNSKRTHEENLKEAATAMHEWCKAAESLVNGKDQRIHCLEEKDGRGVKIMEGDVLKTTLRIVDQITVIDTDAENKNKGKKQEIMTISTMHITPEAVDTLSVGVDADGFRIIPYQSGCMIYAESYEMAKKAGLPFCVMECIRVAEKHGCSWVNIDPEGNEMDELLTYKKQWATV